MKSKKEIKRDYIERTKPAGVFQVKNIANGKVLLGSSMNLEGPLNSHKFMPIYKYPTGMMSGCF